MTETSNTQNRRGQQCDMSEVQIVPGMVLDVRSAMNGLLNSYSGMISFLCTKIDTASFTETEAENLNRLTQDVTNKTKKLFEVFDREDQILGNDGPR